MPICSGLATEARPEEAIGGLPNSPHLDAALAKSACQTVFSAIIQAPTEWQLEARVGIEPAYTALQAAA
jgi:hypothetical protein